MNEKEELEILNTFDLDKINPALGRNYKHLSEVYHRSMEICRAHPDWCEDNAIRAELELARMAAELGKRGGQSTSAKKRKSSRKNGRKGGRPARQ